MKILHSIFLLYKYIVSLFLFNLISYTVFSILVRLYFFVYVNEDIYTVFGPNIAVCGYSRKKCLIWFIQKKNVKSFDYSNNSSLTVMKNLTMMIKRI